MGCSAGVIAISLARELLQVRGWGWAGVQGGGGVGGLGGAAGGRGRRWRVAESRAGGNPAAGRPAGHSSGAASQHAQRGSVIPSGYAPAARPCPSLPLQYTRACSLPLPLPLPPPRPAPQVYPRSTALVVSTENITQNWYFGNDRSMLIPNCELTMLFGRMGPMRGQQ